MDTFLSTETLIIELLLIASLVAMAVQRLRIPYTVALVVVGLAITFQSPVSFNLTPELILALFVPPLVFEAAFHLNLTELRRNLVSILLLAVPGVVLTTFIVGGIVWAGLSISLPMALVFGALIAATDPVAVVALFRTLGVPKRLSILVEGESLFNDGTAIVVFNLMLAITLTGQFDLANSLFSFLQVSIGGLVVGFLMGWLIARLIARVDDYLIETTLTTVLAFGSYLIAERLHFSGVLAVVAAGLVNGNIGPQGMSPTTRIVLFNFWEYLAFLTNSLVFLLIGLEVNIPALVNSWQAVLWAILAVLIARIVVVYSLSWLINRAASPIPFKWQHIMMWGGLRGAISLALVLSLPVSLSRERELLKVMAFGVVLFTLLVQSTTMRLLINKLKIITRTAAQIEYERQHALLTSLRAAESHLDHRHRDGLISTHTWEKLKDDLGIQIARLTDAVRHVLRSQPELESEEFDTAWREVQRARRSALLGLRQDGVISDEVFESLAAEIDAALSHGYTPPTESVQDKTCFLEINLSSEAYAANRDIASLKLPRTAVLVTIRRGKEIIIPRGDTRLLAGDVLTILCERQAAEAVLHHITTGKQETNS